MNKLNKKGFTLVELLAVIVVLAIIMVLTLPTIMNSMNSARQSTFLLYASRMLDTAADKYQSDALLNGGKSCYTIETLNNGTTSKYHGRVLISDNGNTMKVQMYDDNYQIGFNTKTEQKNGEEVDILGDKIDGVTYKDIEAIKKKISTDNSLLSNPTKDEIDKKERTVVVGKDGSGNDITKAVKVYDITCPAE
mgnify:FL=1